MDIVEILNQIVDLLAKSIDHAPFLATIGSFSIMGQIAKSIFSKKKALKKGKFQGFWWYMRLSLPLHPLVAGIALGLYDSARGIPYYAFASVLSVFAFDLIERFTGFDIDLPGDSIIPPEN